MVKEMSVILTKAKNKLQKNERTGIFFILAVIRHIFSWEIMIEQSRKEAFFLNN